MSRFASAREIASSFFVSEVTLKKAVEEQTNMPYNEFQEMHRDRGRLALRRAQFRMAEENPMMNIRLSEIYLDQHLPEKVKQIPNEENLQKLFDAINDDVTIDVIPEVCD